MPGKGAPKTWRSKAREEPAADAPSISDADALTMASMQGDVNAVSHILRGGANVDAKDAIGVAPLHWAAFCGHGEVTARLLEARADVHVRDQEGRTPLHVAAYESHAEVIRRLVDAGADVMAPDKSAPAEGSTAVARASPARAAAFFCALSRRHADETSLPRRLAAVGWTPLHCAVSNGEEGACRQLTESGADPQRKDLEGKSAMDLATHFGNQAVRRDGSKLRAARLGRAAGTHARERR